MKALPIAAVTLVVALVGVAGATAFNIRSSEQWRTSISRSIMTDPLAERHRTVADFIEQEDQKSSSEEYFSQSEYDKSIALAQLQVTDATKMKASVTDVPFMLIDKKEAESDRVKLVEALERFAVYNQELTERLELSKSIANSYQAVAGLSDTAKYAQMLQDVSNKMAKLAERTFATSLDKELAERFSRLAQTYAESSEAFSRNDRAAYDAAIAEFDSIFASNQSRKPDYTAEILSRREQGYAIIRDIQTAKANLAN